MPEALNPFSGETLHKHNFEEKDQITTRLNLAKSAFESWKEYSNQEKKERFFTLALMMEEQKQSLASLMTIEMGKPISESISEIEKCISTIHWYIKHVDELINKHTESFHESGLQSFVRFEPLGTVLGIMPWNFPFWQVFRYAIPTLFMGNTTILKHAPNVQGSAMNMEKLFLQAGFPKGVFQNCFASTDDTEFLIASETIKAVTVTGSEKAGRTIAAIAGQYIKKCVLELGGSDPFIVLKDAPLQKTIQEAIKGRLQNNGQSCIAAKRFIIHEDCYDVFLTGIASEIDKLIIGNPLLTETQLGPLARKDLKDLLKLQVSQSVDAGAKIYYQHTFKDEDSLFFSPVILENIPLQAPARYQELFGPVFCCYKFSTLEEAIALANETDFGLGASIWTGDVDEGLKVARKIDSGAVFINDITRSDARMPFGGIKHSGYGRELSSFGLFEFTNIKTYWMNHNS